MCELSVCSTAIGANKGPEICAYILWSQIVAVDAALVGGQLEQAAYDPLVLLVLLDPARHRRTPDRRKPGGAFLLGARVRACEREIPHGEVAVAVAANGKGPCFGCRR